MRVKTRFLAGFIAIVMLITAFAPESSPTIDDVLEILKSLAGLPNSAGEGATIEDALEILKFLAKLPSAYDTPVTTTAVTATTEPPTTITEPPTTTTNPQTTTTVDRILSVSHEDIQAFYHETLTDLGILSELDVIRVPRDEDWYISLKYDYAWPPYYGPWGRRPGMEFTYADGVLTLHGRGFSGFSVIQISWGNYFEEPTATEDLSEEMELRIKQDYINFFFPSSTFYTVDSVEIVQYSGTYNASVVFRTNLIFGSTGIRREIIAGYIFTIHSGSELVWNDGEIYELREAYDLGLLTAQDMEKIHTHHVQIK
jgi:hypothetical protein